MQFKNRSLFLLICFVASATTMSAQGDNVTYDLDRIAEVTGVQNINSALATQGLTIDKIEMLVTVDGIDTMGQTIFANNRTKNLSSMWVAGDARRLADGNNITYLNDAEFSLANGSIPADPPIDASFQTWDLGTPCSNLPILERADNPTTNPNFVLELFGLTLNPGVAANPFLADIITTGFLPGFVFDLLAPGGSNFILGVTFTLVFIDPATGDPSDINSDGKTDTALKEVWYNDSFLWTDDPANNPGVDIETVALHENGHALELGHFGKIFRTNKNGKLHVSPRAVMNASYLGPVRSPLGTDNAAHCSAFASWPND